uniref:Uncharacterized protein n=1 Tax=Anguilla anguilla TaxID=7936 RepID=A0A0E9SUY6_ANGAN
MERISSVKILSLSSTAACAERLSDCTACLTSCSSFSLSWILCW